MSGTLQELYRTSSHCQNLQLSYFQRNCSKEEHPRKSILKGYHQVAGGAEEGFAPQGLGGAQLCTPIMLFWRKPVLLPVPKLLTDGGVATQATSQNFKILESER